MTAYYLSPTGNDSNQGTSAWPLATFGQLAAKLLPGDSVVWLPGTYKLTAPVSLGRSGTATARIRLAASGVVVLDGSSLPAGSSVLNIQAGFVDVVGFVVQNSPNGGIALWGARDCTVTGCTVKACQTFGIFAGFNAPGTVSGITIASNTVTNCVLANAARAAAGGWAAALTCDLASNVIISGNSVYCNYGEGIDVNHSDNCQVVDNFAHDNFSANIYLDNASNTVVDSNFIFTNSNPAFLRFGMPANGVLLANEVAAYPNPLRNVTVTRNTIIGGANAVAYGAYGAGGGLVACMIAGNKTFAQVSAALSIDADAGHVGTLVSGNQFATNFSGQVLYRWNGGTAGRSGVKDDATNAWWGGAGRGTA